MVCGSVECYNRSSPAASLETGKLLLSQLHNDKHFIRKQFEKCSTATLQYCCLLKLIDINDFHKLSTAVSVALTAELSNFDTCHTSFIRISNFS